MLPDPIIWETDRLTSEADDAHANGHHEEAVAKLEKVVALYEAHLDRRSLEVYPLYVLAIRKLYMIFSELNRIPGISGEHAQKADENFKKLVRLGFNSDELRAMFRQAGALKDDPYADKLREMIYDWRGRPEVEKAEGVENGGEAAVSHALS